MIQSEVEFGSKFWLALQDLSRTHLLYLRRQWGWGTYGVFLPNPTPFVVCNSTSQTRDLVKSTYAVSGNLGGLKDSSFLTSSNMTLVLLVHQWTTLWVERLYTTAKEISVKPKSDHVSPGLNPTPSPQWIPTAVREKSNSLLCPLMPTMIRPHPHFCLHSSPLSAWSTLLQPHWTYCCLSNMPSLSQYLVSFCKWHLSGVPVILNL